MTDTDTDSADEPEAYTGPRHGPIIGAQCICCDPPVGEPWPTDADDGFVDDSGQPGHVPTSSGNMFDLEREHDPAVDSADGGPDDS